MKKSIVVDYDNICAICGKPKDVWHHLIFGQGQRKLADEDGLTIPLCNGCHNMQYTAFRCAQIHDNSMAEALSKAVGQKAWEENYIAEKLADLTIRLNAFTGEDKTVTAEELRDEANTAFMARYGRSYI